MILALLQLTREEGYPYYYFDLNCISISILSLHSSPSTHWATTWLNVSSILGTGTFLRQLPSPPCPLRPPPGARSLVRRADLR